MSYNYIIIYIGNSRQKKKRKEKNLSFLTMEIHFVLHVVYDYQLLSRIL